jgi:cytidine deaminase
LPASGKKRLCPIFALSVGAALECDDGSIYTGCNIENAALGMYHMRRARRRCKAVSEGHALSEDCRLG